MLSLSLGIDSNGIPYVSTDDSRRHSKPSRPGKGKSLILCPQQYVMIDIESTGLDSRYCDIIEIAALRYVDGTLRDSFNSLVKPDEPIGEFIAKLTGITNDMLADAPPIESVIKSFYEFIGDDILIGYNVNFDINFLYDALLDSCGLELTNPFIDVMRIAKKLLPDLKRYKLASVASHYDIPKPAHRAVSDCETTNLCFQRLISDATAQYGSFNAFADTFKRHYLRAKEIAATTESFDENHPLFGKLCVFTGTLEKMQRKEAMQLVVNLGGRCGDNVTAKTDFLILGNNDFCKAIKDGKSSKQKKAEALMLKGNDIEILSENVFYDLVLNQ